MEAGAVDVVVAVVVVVVVRNGIAVPEDLVVGDTAAVYIEE